ncbi:MAG: hypothetical protein QXL01_00260 [Thermoplasmatales archaeon]
MGLKNMDSRFILKVLKDEHPSDTWAFFEELRIGGGFGKDSEQRFDAWAICYFPSKRNVSKCFEIKVSKTDFLSEIRNPKKRRAGLRLSNEFYFVTPEKMLKVEEVPVECGLLEVTELGNMRVVIPAPFRDIEPPTWLFVSSICRREMSKESVPNPEKLFWENLAKDVKTEVYKCLNKAYTEWVNKDNQLVSKVIEAISRDIANIDIQKMIGDKNASKRNAGAACANES